MRFSSLRFRFTLFSIVFLVVSFAIMITISVFSILSTAQQIFTTDGTPLVQKAAGLIDGDRFAQLANRGSDSDPYYTQTREELLALKESSGCLYLYTMVPASKTAYRYIIDGSCDPSDTENFSVFGTTEDISSYGGAPQKCMDTKKVQASGLEKQEGWGWMISVYYPILDSRGTAVGFIGADFDASPILATIQNRIIVFIGVTVLLLAVVICYIIAFTSRLFNRINDVTRSISGIAEGKGDLTQKIPETGHDEISALCGSCNALTESLIKMVKSIKGSVSQLTETGQELSNETASTIESVGSVQFAIVKINERAGRQHESMESVYDSSQKVQEAMTMLTEKIATQTQAITTSSAAIKDIASSIERMDDHMDSMTHQYQQLIKEADAGRKDQKTVMDKVRFIEEQSADLVKANTVIDDIAAQTNLLAMNAAIEAAHAGESGKGFAVVATEIRTLAENSAKQSKSIGTLVQTINEAIHEIVSASDLTSRSFQHVSDKISEIEKMLQQVKVGMDEERKSADNVLGTINIINSSASSINSASAVMQGQSRTVFDGIESLRTSASDIKELSDSANASMKQIAEEAQKSSVAAEKNMDMSNNVLSVVNMYKV